MKDKSFIKSIGFGCVSLTTLPFESAAIKLLETAFDNGICLFDTAPVYGNGYSEKIVGKFLTGKRDKIIITTKFGLQAKAKINIPAWIALPLNFIKKNYRKKKSFHAPSTQYLTINAYRKIDKPEIEESFYKSLKSLKTDYIDNYLMHEALPAFLSAEAINFLMKLKEEGKVLRIGVAAGYGNLINEPNFCEWDILQYENNFMHPSDSFAEKFPGKIHIYHTVLQGIKSLKIKELASEELAGLLLLRAFKVNPDGRVLFSTIKSGNISKNLRGAEKFESLTKEEIKSLISDAIY